MTTLLGVDIGGTKIAAGLVDAQTGDVLFQERVATQAEQGGAAVLQRALDMAQTVWEQAECRPVSIGVGAGGQIDPHTGIVLSATEVLPGWTGTPLKQAFCERFHLPTIVDNDVNALAVGEMRWGAGAQKQSVLFVALGTGVGGAFISGGSLHHGARGAGGEVGHLVLFPDGLPCTCGGRGCLEQYVNGAALVRHWWSQGEDDVLRMELCLPPGASLDFVDGPQIAQAARRLPGGLSARAVRRTGELLGMGLVSLVNLWDPECVVVGGGMADLGELLLGPARDVVRARALPNLRDCPVVAAALGAHASIVGAAALAAPERKQNV